MAEHAPNRFFMEQLTPEIWRLSEGVDNIPQVDSFLVVGPERALYVDSLQFKQPVSLVRFVRAITDKPVDVVMTHGHTDHAGLELLEFVKAGFQLHMSHLDLELGRQMAAHSRGVDPETAEQYAALFSPDVMQDIREGDVFDLGGGVRFEALRVSGHTPGSMCFLDREGRRCFTGDAFGELMNLPTCLNFSTYRDEIKRFEKAVADIPDTKLYNGHLFLYTPEERVAAHATYMRELVEMILSGDYPQEPQKPTEEDPKSFIFRSSLFASHKSVHRLYYTRDKVC